MAKRNSRWPSDDDSDFEVEDEDTDIVEREPESGSSKSKSCADADKSEGKTSEKSRDFFQTIGAGLKAAGKTAEKYTRMGIQTATLEKQRLDLRSAYAKLGEAVHRCWDAAPDLGVTGTDASVSASLKVVNELRRKIRESEIKLRELKKS